MKKYKYYTLAFLCVFAIKTNAQNPAVAKKQEGVKVFTNAHIFIGNGKEIKNGSLVIENGLIKEVSEGNVSSNYANAKVVDIQGKHIYPGVISPNNSLGLSEIEAVRTTQDYNEIGNYNPNVRSLIAYNTDSEVIPTVRANGVLITQATPEGGTMPGRSSIMNLDGWNWEDAALKADDGVWINWPAKIVNSFNMETFTREQKKNEKYQANKDEIFTFFEAAKVFNSNDKTFDNLKYAALSGIFSGKDRLYISVAGSKEAIDAILFCKSQNILHPVIVGAVSSETAINLLKENNIPILIPGTHRLPEHNDDDVWDAYKLPSKLFDKGILVGMYYNASYWRTRNLPFVAGNAAAHGLSKANALQMITLNNAKILGIDNMVGSIEKGKLATFVVSKGDILDMMYSKIEMAFISGAEVILDDKQKRLSKKYHEKYNVK